MSTIIIEGPDGAGKTKLLNQLLEKYPEYQAAPRPCSSSGGPLYGRKMIDYLCQYGCLDMHIYDRHPAISGAVYDGVFGRPQPGGVFKLAQGAFYWALENAKIIYCRPPMSVIARSVLDCPQMDGVLRNIYRIVDAYDGIMQNLITHEVYDWTTDDLPSL